VILGMGYDNTLGDNIGITLIATGFEHRDPFEGAMIPEKKKPEEEKIMMTLGVDGEETKLYGQPSLPFTDKDPFAPQLVDGTGEPQPAQALPLAEEKPEVYILAPEPVWEEPRLVFELPVEPPVAPTADPQEKTDTEPVMYTERVREDFNVAIVAQSISSLSQVPTENLNVETGSAAYLQSAPNDTEQASTTLTSGGFLAKPSNIYAEEPMDLKSKEKPLEEPVTLRMEEDGPIFDMQLVIKESNAVDEPGIPQVHAHLGSHVSVEEPAMQDEAEELKRKAAERIHKLRNLSFNINAADPNNEFESVPAYVRRNLEVHNTTLTSVEKFYSKYTVKPDENNQGQISSLNSFLDGKKPD